MDKKLNLNILILIFIVILMSNFVLSDITLGKIHEYKFDGNASNSVSSAHGIVSGAILVEGINGSAYSFDGVDDYINLGFSGNMFGDWSSFSISFWIYSRNELQTAGILGNLNPSSNYGFAVFHHGVTDSYTTYTSRAGGGSHQYSESGVLTQDEWQHIVISYGSGYTTIWVNGIVKMAVSTLNWFENSANVLLGHPYSSLTGSGKFYGYIDELVIYNRVLSTADVEELYTLFAEVECIEDWQVNYGTCESGDRRFKYYIDSNFCGTIENLPLDHNTYVYDCDFCVEDWQEDYSDCEIDDSMQKFYTDLNSCNEYNDLPLDNGTSMYCNYCTEDIVLYQDECLFNGTDFYSYQEYEDNNYFGCCAITGLVSDCSIFNEPYNESGIIECAGYSQDFEIEYDNDILFGINPEDRVYWKLFINDTETESEYDCISYVKNMQNGIIGNVIQINPSPSKKSERTFTLKTKYEDREFFQMKNNIGSAYFTREDLVFDSRPYLFGVECVNGENKLNAERVVYPSYESINRPLTILTWAKNNSLSLLVGFVMVFVIFIFIGIAYKRYRFLK